MIEEFDDFEPEIAMTSLTPNVVIMQSLYLSVIPITKKPSSPLPTPSHIPHIRVNVHAKSQDPAGKSPMKASVCGHQSAKSVFFDPVGESPTARRRSFSTNTEPMGDSPYHKRT